MNHKSSRHKSDNTFKFQTFAERIASIDINVYHRIGHENESEGDQDECYFYQAIQHWNMLNITESYEAFKKEIKDQNLVTLPQLLLDKNRVVEVLLKHIKLKNPLSLQPLLDLVVALAKDLRKEFYPYFMDFFQILIELLNTKNTEQLEWVFTCLAYLFKFLSPAIIRDITSVFSALLPLLSSQKPEFIRNFAAEGFSYVARKIKDKRAFLEVTLRTVKKHKDGIEGCGRLWFEVIHGVSKQFHSCTEDFLTFLLESLSDPKLPQTVLYLILEQMIEHIVCNISPQKSQIFWSVFIKNLENLINNKENRKTFELLLKLLGQAIEYKNGKFLIEPKPVVEMVGKVATSDLPEEILLLNTQIAIILLNHINKLTQEQSSVLIKKHLNIESKSIFLFFVENTVQCTLFEPLILPKFLKYCLNNNLDDETFEVLIKILLKKCPFSESGLNLKHWNRFPLDFREESNKIMEILLKNLDYNNIEKYVGSLICIPHIYGIDQKIINNLYINLENILKDLNEQKNLKKSLFLLNYTLECLVHLNENLEEKFDSILRAVLPLAKNENYISALKIIDLLITVMYNNDNIINKGNLGKLNEELCINFNSPFHEIRLLTSHLYSFFENLPQFNLKHSDDPEVPQEPFKVFTFCYEIEKIDSQVDTYREQVKILEKFNYDKSQMIMCSQTEFKTIPLRYLCGCLYINFKLLWEPTMNVIQSHAQGMNIKDFWGIFGVELKNVVENIKKGRFVDVDVITTNWGWFGDLYQNTQKLKTKPDFFKYRLLLWKTLALFPQIAEAKTRDVSEIFLNYIEEEYTNKDPHASIFWNLKKENNENLAENKKNEEDEENDTKDNMEQVKPEKGNSKGSNVELLHHCLTVFSKVQSPKSMYREPELSKLYFNFLQHKKPEIQKAAFDCILRYRHRYLTPYQENIYNLIDPKKFKNEIVTFRIDKESEIAQDHRKDLIPIILNIVLSKMTGKTGQHGKSSDRHRHLVFRFLAGCQEDEMLLYLKMTFRLYNEYLEDDVELMVKKVCKGVDLEHFLSPKRLGSATNLLLVVLNDFGALMSANVINYLIKITLIIGALIRGAYEQKNFIKRDYGLRQVKNDCLKVLKQFFELFDWYQWTKEEINAIFYTFIWPHLNQLNVEGIHSPTAFLKLIIQWGSNPRYFGLLVKFDSESNDYILKHVVDLLNNEQSRGPVINAIWNMFEKMLTLVPDEEDMKLEIPIDNLLPIEKSIQTQRQSSQFNYGSCLLLPFAIKILQKIKKKLVKSINNVELLVLSRISELVWEAEVSDEVLKLILPIVLKRSSSSIDEEQLNQYLIVIENLLKNVENPSEHLKHISPLFTELTFTSSRKLLLKFLDIISAKNSINFDIVKEINSFDAKWIDQPDYEKRHEGFKKIQENLDSLDVPIGVLILHSCFNFLKHGKDLALKDTSSHILQCVSVKLLQLNKDTDYILQILFQQICKEIKTKESHRNEYITLLGHLARESPNSSPILRDLNYYSNSMDLEVDFFQNLVHLQSHRHTRALLKFSEVTRGLKVPLSTKTLTQFILPLASYYLCNPDYASSNSIVDSSIEAIGVIARVLPWYQYEMLLKFYLHKLRYKYDFQKQMVRTVMAILDAFHFDLSKADTIQQAEEEVKEKENLEISEEKESLETDKVNDEEENDENHDEKENQNDKNEDSILKDIEDVEIEEDEEQSQDAEEKTLTICEKITILGRSASTRARRTIQNTLLPQLHRALAEFTAHELSHKYNKKKTLQEREEKDLCRVPLSLAMVKLLQKLPSQCLLSYLPGIFLKLCSFLKSRLESVRKLTRETLQKIMQALGTEYLGLLLSEMTACLNRGYQVHVLVFTVHAILYSLENMFKEKDIDSILTTVLKLCKTDLFGALSEEKEVGKIVAKTSEAGSTKSFSILQIISKYITEQCLMDLILPIKDVLQISHSFKVVQKAEECLKNIVLGLVENKFIPHESLLKFAYGSVSQSIPELTENPEKEKETKENTKERVDCFIIPPPPVWRSGVRQNLVKYSKTTNTHLLIEFGLKLIVALLKDGRIQSMDINDCKPYLDPFVPIVKDCLKSKHVKLSTLALKCLGRMMVYDLPSMRNNIEEITRIIFEILHKFAAPGLKQGENFDLVLAAFKTVSILVRDVKYHVISTEQLKILLFYVEQDMYDHDRQASSFNLLRAIISRKLIVSEIYEVMNKIAELSISSELDHVRQQARSVFYHFFMEYPMEKNFDRYVSFYLAQLEYELRFGRESAIEMIQTIISGIPLKILIAESGTFFVSLGARLINDEEPECRKKVANCLKILLERLNKEQHDPLFEMIVVWLKNKNPTTVEMAAQLCGLLIVSEKAAFESRLKTLFPIIEKIFGLKKPGRFVTVNKETEDQGDERAKDHQLFQVLQMMQKMCALVPGFLKQKEIETFAYHIQLYLSHPHDWVRLSAAQFLGFVLSTVDIDKLAELLLEKKSEDAGYLLLDPLNHVKSLALDLCDQLQPGVKAELAEQVIKNLLFVARVLQKLPLNHPINLLWLAKKMRGIINKEIIKNPTSTVLRTEVFKWIAGACTILEVDNVKSILNHLMAPLVREIVTTEVSNAPLRHLAKDVGGVIKKRIGINNYNKELMKLEQNLNLKRADRKRKQTQMAVTDPEIHAKKKIKKQEKRKLAKKRKVEQIRGKKSYKRRKTVDLENNEII